MNTKVATETDRPVLRTDWQLRAAEAFRAAEQRKAEDWAARFTETLDRVAGIEHDVAVGTVEYKAEHYIFRLKEGHFWTDAPPDPDTLEVRQPCMKCWQGHNYWMEVKTLEDLGELLTGPGFVCGECQAKEPDFIPF